MRIAIDAGHGPETAGKRSPDGSLREYHFNAPTARYVAESLSQYQDVQTLLTFEDSRDVPLKERTDKANAWGANLLISIHANAFGEGGWNAAEGIETFVYTTRPAPSVALANAVQRQIVKLTGRTDRGVKSENFHMVREPKAKAAILVECGFMTNKQEVELLKSDTYRRKCALAIVMGIVETYGLKLKPQPVKEDPLPVIQKLVGVIVNDKPVGDGFLVVGGISYIPARIVAETFGAKVGWDGQNVIINRGGEVIR